jgi:glutamine synthetase
MAETVTIAKWIIRNICAKHGVSVSFSPKPALEHAGNGMHIHLCGLKNSKNIITDSKGNLTAEAKQMIGGILKFAPSLTAFGNTIPVSYLRFISREESPMYVCWGTRNRLALIRKPLWWNFRKDFTETDSRRRTFEFRAPDPSANTYLLLAGIAVAVEYGLKNPKKAMKIADDLNAEKMFKRNKKYKVLPLSCSESAKSLRRDRKYYEAYGVFPKRVIEEIIRKLESYKDRNLRKKLAGT